MQIGHYLPRTLPTPLEALAGLALDLRLSWQHSADELWRAISPELWDATGNPWLILESVSDQRLNILAADKEFLRMLEQQLADREAFFQADTWFSALYGDHFQGHIAYFSMEFGLCESLPIYSGGLGVLAGDQLKTASDLDVPIIGIGLLYQQGYFRQALDAHGEQLEFYPFNDPTQLPVMPLRDDKGEWIRLTITLPGRSLRLRTWQVQVGRRVLFLLDSNDLLNDPGDRGITSELYGGGPELRLQQEMVLGLGGWNLLERLGIDCPVCHLNEGHAAFAILERARYYQLRTGQTFAVALRATRAGNLFTTHTPVAAGFDRFSAELISVYFADYVLQLGISLADLLALGRRNRYDPTEPFNMAYLAIRGVAAINGVSRLHGEVSRDIFQPLFPHWPRAEVPVQHVTNGVHMPSWDSAAADAIWTEFCGKARWCGALETVEADLRQVGDAVLWNLRSDGRRQLITFLRNRLQRQHCSRNTNGAFSGVCGDLLDPDTLTLGFARRFAEYKRTNLLLQDPDRLLKLFSNRDRPVQLVIAGKAHPRDSEGKRLLHEWQQFLTRPQVNGRIVFIEDYDLVVAERLVQGVDVWINTPRRPWEASGTSGMKVLVNGGLNLSELDGWWAEAYSANTGWALGDVQTHTDVAAWDKTEAAQLYRILEDEVLPCFYRRDETGMPREWIVRIRESMANLTTRFSSNRMLREYVESYYLPLATAYRQRSTAIADELQHWHRQLSQHWQHLHFGNVKITPTATDYWFEVQVYLDELPAHSVCVELYAEALTGTGPVRQLLQRGALLSGASNAYVYQGSVPANRPALDYTPRIIPMHDKASVPIEADFILWYR